MGQDIHAAVAAQIHGVPIGEVTREQRGGAKMVNFGIVYGITAFGLARRLGVSNTEAAEIIDGYKKRFAGITTFLEECIAQAKRHGYRPIVYPNDKLRQSGQVAVQADTDACLAEAKEYLESGRAPELAKQTAEGAVVGGAVGGAVGAVTSSVGRGAAAGAAGGAAGSLARGLWHWNDPDPAERGYVEHCLRERGYDVIGWR